MKKHRQLIIVIFMFSLAIRVCPQSVYFVSADGSESGDGTLQKPFQTVRKAVEKARMDKGETIIYIRGGSYRLDQPLVFTSADGNNSKHLNLKAFPDEKVVFSGGIRLNLKWQPYKKGIMKAHVQDKPVMDMLIVNGVIRHMARYPNYDEKAIRFNGTSGQSTAPGRVKKWKKPEGGYLHAMHQHDWGDFHYRITGKDHKGELKLEGGWQNNRKMGLHKENRMVENIFEELDVPGEWYYHNEEQTLYYYPLEGEDIHNAQFEAPQIKHLIEFRGTEAHPVKNIVVEGIELTQTLRTFMEQYEQLLRSDWTVYRGGAVVFEGTENCGIQNCYLHNLGGNGVFFTNYNRYSEVSGSHFTQIGASAICFVGDVEGVRSPSFEYNEFVPLEKMDRTKGPKNNNHPAYCKVHNNLIHRIGLYEKQITGVELSMSRNITISHNSIYHTPRAGINISEGTWGGHIIEFNDVFDTVKETGDHGSFNSWGRDRYWNPEYKTMESIVAKEPALILADAIETVTIRNNRFRCDRGWDIDLDDGSSNFHIYNNLCLNGGIKLREGFYRVVENNIMVNNAFHPHVWFLQSGDIFTRNIVMTAYKPINVREWGLLTDYNIFTDSMSLKAVQKNNTDIHSLVVPVIFTNPSMGDFTVPDNSEAIVKGGFHNFAMDQFGVVSPQLKAIAKTPEMPVPIIVSTNLSGEIVNWHGVTFKNMQTLGERSATGMDSERGVYVISVDALDSNLRDYIKPNDVILEIGNKLVNNLNEMFEAIKKVDKAKEMRLTIFRSQKENTVLIPGKFLLEE